MLARPYLVNSIYRRRKFHRSKNLRLYGVHISINPNWTDVGHIIRRPGVGFLALEPSGDQNLLHKKSIVPQVLYILGTEKIRTSVQFAEIIDAYEPISLTETFLDA